jgi:hypothetical protein
MRRPSYLPSPSTPCGDRSGLRSMVWPTTPSADFCRAVGWSCDHPSPVWDTRQISRGKSDSLPRTPARFTAVVLDGYGLRSALLARPITTASYLVSVRRDAISFHASFRRSLAIPPLRFARASPPSGCTGDFHPQAAGHARHTALHLRRTASRLRGLTATPRSSVGHRCRRRRSLSLAGIGW